jgi:hypothetical protein
MIPRKITPRHKRTSGETVLDRARFREEYSVSSLRDGNLPAATAIGNLEIYYAVADSQKQLALAAPKHLLLS